MENDIVTDLTCFYFMMAGVVYLLNSKPLTLHEAEKILAHKSMLKEILLWPAYIWPFRKTN
jgi:hypothetical protein